MAIIGLTCLALALGATLTWFHIDGDLLFEADRETLRDRARRAC